MTTKWIAVSLAVLALAGCHKKDEAKPPPPKPDTPTTSTTTSTTTTTSTPPPAPATPPAGEVQPPVAEAPPTTTETPASPSGYKPAVVQPRLPTLTKIPTPKAETPPASATPSGGRPPPIRIGGTGTVGGVGGRPPPLVIKKTQLQLAAETNVLGAWVQSDQKTSILRFTPSGWVSLERGNSVINGKWTANSAGAVNFSLPVPGGDAKLVANFNNTKATGRYIVVVPNQDGPQIWPRYGQLIFNPQIP